MAYVCFYACHNLMKKDEYVVAKKTNFIFLVFPFDQDLLTNPERAKNQHFDRSKKK